MSGTQYGVGIDTGSSTTRCVLLALQNGMLRYVAHGEVKSAGWQKGRISNGKQASETIRSVVSEVEQRSGLSIEGVVAGIAGPGIEGFNSRGLYNFGRAREIDIGDLNFAIELACKLNNLTEERLILQVAPQDFTVDGQAEYRNPLNMVCKRLEANVYIITALRHEHQALVNAIHQAHLSVEETVFEPVAAAYACVLSEERARGVAVIDIGAQSTDIAIYEGDALVRATTTPLSAEHFTRDISQALKVSYEDAESLKSQYGSATVELTPENSIIEIPSHDGRPPREASRRHLNDILEARAEEIFDFVRNEILRVSMDRALYEGVVLTGAGAQLHGTCDVAEKILNCQARNGLVIGVEGWPDEIDDSSWCVGAGLAMYSAKLKTRRQWKRPGPGWLGWF